MSKIRVAVVFGGVSSEYEVSLVSASSVIRNMDPDRYEIVCIGITKNGRWLYFPGNIDMIARGDWDTHPDCTTAIISPDRSHKGILKIMSDGSYSLLKIDCVFPVLHGKNGEDGTIQGLFSLAGIPYIGCDTLSSASCMDKAVTHVILDQASIKTAKWNSITRSSLSDLDSEIKRFETKLGFPMFVKPANAGSSVGVNKASNPEELKEAIKIAFAHDKKVVIEQAIIGIEVECAVLGNDRPKPSVPGEITPCNDFYDYDAKYILGESALHIPARIDADTTEKLQDIAVKAYLALGCAGLSRVDFFVTKDNDIILNEINTIPGFTSISMYPKLWEASGLGYAGLIDELITLAIERADF
ncbi:MAG: ddl [Oscillospiraceae bacterium]|jgi:D-alanine-D-alanine ligase|nr:ddl [Oscillospiraceae bacterium]